MKKRLKGTTPEEVKARLAAGPFRLADRLAELVRDYGNALKLAAAAFIRHGFEQRRKRENFQTFNDLLQEVHHALHAASSPLPAVLRQRYPVGIVDEFQDTDPVQYEIFTSIFRPPEGTLYMVGDRGRRFTRSAAATSRSTAAPSASSRPPEGENIR